jgi:hypothetical protein
MKAKAAEPNAAAVGPRHPRGCAHTAEWPGIAPPRYKTGALRPSACPGYAGPPLGVRPRLEVSRRHLLEDTIV